MEIKRKYFAKYLHSIAIEQIAEEYSQKGYSISKEESIGKYQADIIAKKGEEVIVIEVKAGKMTPEKKEAITQLGNYVKSKGNYKFLVAIASTPKEKKLKIANIEELLTQLMIENLPDELDELSTHTRIDEITDVNINEISIDENSIFVKGEGVVSIELQFGSGSDNDNGHGYSSDDSFPFEFEVTCEYDSKKELQISDITKLKVDTSSYYE